MLFLGTDAFGAPGGIAQYNRDLLTALSDSGRFSKIHVLVRAGDVVQALPPGVRQCKAIRSKLLYALASVKSLLKDRPDILFCGHLNLLPLCWLLSVVSGVPLWLQLHGIDSWQAPSRQVRRMTEHVRLVTCVSRFTRRCFLGWSVLDPARVRVLPNTVSDQFQPIDREAARRHFGIESGQRVLLTVGRLSSSEQYKGHDRVLRAVAGLTEEIPEIRYLIAGTGDDLPRLEALSAELGIFTRVQFLGQVGTETLNTLYNAADLYVMPSTGEGFGIVFLEAMAAGTPAMGLSGDGSVDPLRDGTLGTVTDEEHLAQAINGALQTPREPALPANTQHYFGFHAFRNRVAQLLATFNLQPPVSP